MAQSYEHIKVTPAEDEVVIIAGSKGPAREAVAEEAASDESNTSGNAGAAKGTMAAKGPTFAKPAGKAPKADKDAYQPTTLEDIESSKMPTTQIAVIVVAVVALIAFGIWFAVLS